MDSIDRNAAGEVPAAAEQLRLALVNAGRSAEPAIVRLQGPGGMAQLTIPTATGPAGHAADELAVWLKLDSRRQLWEGNLEPESQQKARQALWTQSVYEQPMANLDSTAAVL